MSNRSLFILLLVMFAVCVGQWVDTHQREQQLRQQIQQLTQGVVQLEQRLTAVEAQVETLRSESMGEVVRKANGALLDAWKGLLQKLDKEVDEARDEFERRSDAPAGKTDPESLKRT